MSYTITCYYCNGSGKVELFIYPNGTSSIETCSECHGSGQLEEEDSEEDESLR